MSKRAKDKSCNVCRDANSCMPIFITVFLGFLISAIICITSMVILARFKIDESNPLHAYILMNVVLSLAAILFLFFATTAILRRSRLERAERNQLIDRSERAIVASEAKSSFLSSMSHEIRTPINVVLGMNEMILRESSDDSIVEYASNIENAGKTLLALINSILDFSKIEEGKMEIVPVEYETRSMINNLVVSISERAAKKGLNFIVEVDGGLPSRLFGDDVRLSQVIMNLLTNAVKYTERGHVCLTIRGEKMEADSIAVFVSVEDTGIGIRQGDMGRLFESFERLDEVKNHSIEGTGLGMSIVTGLLQMMGSKINVNSVYGNGTTFSFTVEQKIVDATPMGDYAKSPVERRRRPVKEAFSAPTASVLVVDDNEMNLKVAKNLLRLFDISPDMVASGRDCIVQMRARHYDVVFLDHMMPKMDGMETLRTLQESALIPEDTVMVALTANAVMGAKEQYVGAGFDAYLSKPIEVGELGDLLKTYLPADMVSMRKEEEDGAGGKADGGQTVAISAGSKGRDGADEKDGDGAAEKGEDGDVFLEFAAVEDGEDGAAEKGGGDGDAFLEVEAVEDGDGEDGIDGDGAAEKGSGDGDAFLEFAAVEDGDGEDGAALLSALSECGLDTESAMDYCAWDVDMYLDLLDMYVKSCSEKAGNLGDFYEAGDWKEYQVLIHAIKTTSRTIGATALSEQAFSLEQASEQMDVAFIRANHEPFLKAYRTFVERLLPVLKKS